MTRRFEIIVFLLGIGLVSACTGQAVPRTATPLSPTAQVIVVTATQPPNGAQPAQTGASSPTPTPTPPPIDQPGPTLQPAPSQTPTQTPVPTVQPPTLAAPAAGLPTGWMAYSASYDLDPANVNPSTIACHLHSVRFDGSADRDLTPDSHDCAASPAISPDGRWIAVLSGYARNMSAGMVGSIVVISADGSQCRTFNPTPLSTGGLRWSKDGAQIAYYFEGDSQWHIIDAQTGAAVGTPGPLNTGSWVLPNLSPDGQYRAGACQPDQQNAGQHVCVTGLAADTRPLGSSFEGGIAWSPDGQWIGYVDQDGLTLGDTSKDGTYLMHPDGTGAVRISTQYAGAFWFGAAQ